MLLSDKQLKEEIRHLKQNKELQSQLTAAMTWTEEHRCAVDIRRQSIGVYSNSERLSLLLKWCKIVSSIYGMKVMTCYCLLYSITHSPPVLK